MAGNVSYSLGRVHARLLGRGLWHLVVVHLWVRQLRPLDGLPQRVSRLQPFLLIERRGWLSCRECRPL